MPALPLLAPSATSPAASSRQHARARGGEPRGDRAAEHAAADHRHVEPGHARTAALPRPLAARRPPGCMPGSSQWQVIDLTRLWSVAYKGTDHSFAAPSPEVPMYDAIVVGARCAGSPTAMLLARAGHRVLLVDRATFPSDTLSTHYIHQPGVAALDRWGLLPSRSPRLGRPPIRRYRFDLGPFALDGRAPAARPRRRRLLRAPRRPGRDPARRRGRRRRRGAHGLRGRRAPARARPRRRHRRAARAAASRCTARARLVIGADGMGSVVARAAGARTYDEQPALTCAYYTYWPAWRWRAPSSTRATGG